MDENTRFRQQGLPTPNGQFQPLAPQQFSSAQSQVPTLPPISGSGAQFYNPTGHHSHHNSNGQTPTASRTPSTSGPSANTSMAPLQQHHQLRPIQPTPSPYMSMSSYGSSQTSAPGHINGQHPLPLHNNMHGLNFSLQGQYHTPMLPHPQPEPEPVHVVGQQGRRGVLPTHPGRPPPSKAPQLPTKNADNKFECPHCVKTYLHLKHLKRHLLRRELALCAF